MTGIETPAMASIRVGELLPEYALRSADNQLRKEGIDPISAFVDDEINRHHRAIALQVARRVDELISRCLISE